MFVTTPYRLIVIIACSVPAVLVKVIVFVQLDAHTSPLFWENIIILLGKVVEDTDMLLSRVTGKLAVSLELYVVP